MKKNLFGWLAMATMLVGTGCSSDEVVNDYSPENAIQFGTYVGRDAQGRAAETTLATLKSSNEGFGVFAYYTEQDNYTAGATPNFMFNQQVTFNSNDNKWEYNPLKYWPNNTGDKVSFFAYAPYDSKYTEVTGTTSKINFIVENEVKNQIDLLWNNKKHIDETKQTVSDNIDFNFAHALSRITFTVQAAVDEIDVSNKVLDANTTITINSVVLKGDGTMNVADPAGAFYTAGDLDLNNYLTNGATYVAANWSNQQGMQAFRFGSNHFETSVLNSNNSKNKNQLLKDDSYLMIIPQNFSSSSFYVYIDYTVTTTDSANGLNSSTINNRMINSASLNFESGKAYTINLCLGMTSVKLDAIVDSWGNEDGSEVDLPENYQ